MIKTIFQILANMSFDHLTQFMAQMAELRNNRDDADVTLNCQGEVIMAHSFILKNRYLITQVSIVTRYFHEK